MPKNIYCWRCEKDVPMLTEQEWASVEPHLAYAVKEIKRYRIDHGCTVAEAAGQSFGREALRLYEQITGVKETDPIVLFHHRLSLYGQPCARCGKPLRTPAANHCAACGEEPEAESDCDDGKWLSWPFAEQFFALAIFVVLIPGMAGVWLLKHGDWFPGSVALGAWGYFFGRLACGLHARKRVRLMVSIPCAVLALAAALLF